MHLCSVCSSRGVEGGLSVCMHWHIWERVRSCIVLQRTWNVGLTALPVSPGVCRLSTWAALQGRSITERLRQPWLRPRSLSVPSACAGQTELAVSAELLGLRVASFMSVQASIFTLSKGFSEKYRMRRRASVSVFSPLRDRHKIVRLSKQ